MPIFLILSICSPLIPILVGLKKKLTLLWMYAFTALFFDVLITILRRALHWNFKWPANVFILLEFIIVSLIYREQIAKNKKAFNVLIVSVSVLFVGSTILKSVFEFNMREASFFYLAYMIYSLSGFYQILQQRKIVFIERYWFFWFNIAFIIYPSGNYFLFLFKEHLAKEDLTLFLNLWGSVFFLLNILKNIFLGIALYYYKPLTNGPS